MIRAPLLADNDNDWAASAPCCLHDVEMAPPICAGVVPWQGCVHLALAETKICTCAPCNYLLIS